jgi:hypothetical protein
MSSLPDILSRIKATEATINPERGSRLVKRYVVMLGDGSGRASSKLYTYARGRKLVARAKRFGIDVYISAMMLRLPL